MGRPTKQGIDYFPMDVDWFSDIKIRRILKACGTQSSSILLCLLCNIYRNNGYYISWDKDMPFVIADEVGVSEGAVNEVVIKALQVDFFNQTMYDKHNILTSVGIQKRYMLATYQRKDRQLNKDYLISCANNGVSCTKNRVICTDNPQSKENKKKKENSTNVEQKKPAAAKAATNDIEKRKKKFYDSLIPFVDTYGKEMVRNFFDYWTELKPSGRKMRFELERTWEVSKRLARWADNNSRFKQPMDVGIVLHDNSTSKYQNEEKWNR